MRGRGLKRSVMCFVFLHVVSLPVRGRGLKRSISRAIGTFYWSLPVRGRGLKLSHDNDRTRGLPVAPRAGARIETSEVGWSDRRQQFLSLPVRGRGLKLLDEGHLALDAVSLPVRGRGLKR